MVNYHQIINNKIINNNKIIYDNNLIITKFKQVNKSKLMNKYEEIQEIIRNIIHKIKIFHQENNQHTKMSH